MNDRQNIGAKGENIALEYLRGMGMTLIEKNWRSGHAELDLIMHDGHAVRFIEVKTVTDSSGFDPLEQVTSSKIRHLSYAAQNFIYGYNEDVEFFFDIIGIVTDNDRYAIEYIPDAFRFHSIYNMLL